MTEFSAKLSAYLDGELDPAETAEVEARLAKDAAAQKELDALLQANAFVQEKFEAELDAPIPFSVAQHIRDTELAAPAPTASAGPERRPIWGTLAAGLAIFGLGGLGGYALKNQDVPNKPGWIAAIADYHAIYAEQERHLVEVGADEADHIEAWLGKTVGTTFTIPDLTAQGLTFEGGRLVVANGKPVAQLMYRQADGTVVAVCLQKSNKDPDLAPTFNQRTINGFDFVSWSADGADYVVIGPQGFPELNAIATAASLDI